MHVILFSSTVCALVFFGAVNLEGPADGLCRRRGDCEPSTRALPRTLRNGKDARGAWPSWAYSEDRTHGNCKHNAGRVSVFA